MKKTYQINQERALQRFNAAAQKSKQEIQFALPLPEVVALISRGLMQVALAALRRLAEEMMKWEVDELLAPKSQARGDKSGSAGGSRKATAW